MVAGNPLKVTVEAKDGETTHKVVATALINLLRFMSDPLFMSFQYYLGFKLASKILALYFTHHLLLFAAGYHLNSPSENRVHCS